MMRNKVLGVLFTERKGTYAFPPYYTETLQRVSDTIFNNIEKGLPFGLEDLIFEFDPEVSTNGWWAKSHDLASHCRVALFDGDNNRLG